MRKHALTLRMATIVLVVGMVGLCATPAVAGAQFGIASFSATASTSQAGAHPDLAAAFALHTEALGNPVGQIKTAAVALAPGFIGNPQATEKCSRESFQELLCPTTAQVGVLDASFVVCTGISTPLQAEADAGATTITVASTAGLCAGEPDNTITIGTGASAETAQIAYVLSATTLILKAPLEHTHAAAEAVTHIAQTATVPIPLFNLQPTPGHTATFGASLLVANILVQVDMRPDGQLIATINELSTLLPLTAATLTLWGVPADPSHNSLRCNQLETSCGPSGAQPAPFTTNPTDCDGPAPETGLTVESWEGQSAASTAILPQTTGCAALVISAGLHVTPDTTRRDTPAGYDVQLEIPQNTEPYGLAVPDLSGVTVTLPAGTSLSPAFANGLQTCTDAQFAERACPHASMLGTVEITTPLLAEHLTGALYIGTPTSTEKYRLLLTADADNVAITLAGRIEPNETTGQITAVFDDTPQLPFSALKLSLFGGPAAALANPATCGTATSTSQITTYAGATAAPSSNFTVDEDGEGGACPASPTFTPSFIAGTTLPLAGSFSPFTLNISRNDGEPDLAGFTAQLPPGLTGLLKTVIACPEPQAGQGACTPASEVGTATISAGAGAQPLDISGPVYLTGPYHGAPFGLATVVNATVGPFDLGTAIVRSRILLDPSNLALTIVSDPLPQIFAGIPLRLRTLNITLNRSGFVRNPTNCDRQQITATISGTEGTPATISTPFEVAGCADLPFIPRLTASTQAQASNRGDGASLDLDIVNPTTSTATIRSAIIELPASLRPRLTTIQHACLVTGGVIQPSACPRESLIGTATVRTPVLASPLSGTIYLVAHGGATLPSLVMLLQGNGIEVELAGSLAISRAGAISAAFRTLPDAPISAFELSLPRGPHSILGAIGSPCGRPLELPYRLTDQSGREINATARITVSGCPRRAKKRRARHSRRA
jgi:hypothetical protein